MTYLCPLGHESQDPDQCSECAISMSDSGGLPRNPTPPIAPPSRCPSCGTEWRGNVRFCPQCGVRAATAEEPPTPAVEVVEFEAVISADRDYYDHGTASSAEGKPPFPVFYPERTVRLSDNEVAIGRARSGNRDRPLPPINLGEKPASDIGVSQQHAALMRDGDDWYVVDTESKNGTYVDGVRIERQAPLPLRTGSVIHLGFWTAIRVRRRGSEGDHT